MMTLRTLRWVKAIRLWGDSRPNQCWEADGYLIRKFNITGLGAKPYRAFTLTVTDPKAKWGPCGPIGMKTAAVGPYRRYLAEAKQDAERFDFERGK